MRPYPLFLLLTPLLLLGCDRSKPTAGTATLTYHQHIAPILARQCASCHHPGGSAPFSLLTFQDVKKHAAQIAKVTQSRFMPPWLPEPGYGQFANERRLSDHEIDLIARWAANDAPAGPPAPALTQNWSNPWQLGQPDLIVQLPRPYALVAAGKDVYRNFVFPLPSKSPRWVRAVEFHPGNRQVVHHALILLDTSGSARRMDALDKQLGFGGMDVGEDVSAPPGQLLSWQPGRLASADDAARAWRLPTGADLVVQAHMRPDGKTEPVQPSVGFYFTDQPPTQLPFVLLLKSTAIDIPPGESNYVIESSYTLPVDVELIRILPHAHYLGRQLSGSATFPDGTIHPLILIKNWDFNWQSDYRYASPMFLPKGTRLSMRFTYDNSQANIANPNRPPKRVRYGPQSSDEMAELWLQVVPRSQQDLQTLAMDYSKTYRIPDLISYYRAVLKNDPKDVPARAKLGGALVAAGQIDNGITELHRAIEIDPSNATAHFNLASALTREDQIADAMNEYEATLRLDPDDYRAHNNLGMIYMYQGKLDRASHHFYNALRINPHDILANNNLANLFLAQQNWGQARLQLETLLTLDPDNQSARKTLQALKLQLEKTN